MKHVVLALIITMVVGNGCATICPEPAMKSGSVSQSALLEADRLLDDGKYADAVAAYRKIEQAYPGSEGAALAHYTIAVALVSPDNLQRNYASALTEFENFIALYPQNERVREARSWKQAIKQFLDAKKENEQLKSTIQKLQLLDLQQEQKRSGK
jgi:outer membrane protein assembly factor BamD (BamD/ComL family)